MSTFIDFTAGQVFTAGHADTLMRQSVMRFDSESDRNTALSGYLEEGMLCYTTDANTIWLYNGTEWVKWFTEWSSYTPTWTNLTPGNATVNAQYRYQGGDLRQRGRLTWGSTTSGTGSAISQDLENSETSDTASGYGSGIYLDSGTRNYPLAIGLLGGFTAFAFYYSTTTGTGELTSTSPATMATGDIITLDITVPLA